MKYCFVLLAWFLLLLLGSCKEKVTIVALAEQKNNTVAEAVLIEATKYKLLGQYNASVELYLDYLLKYPNSATAHYQLAQLYFELGEYNEMYASVKRAYELAPSNKYIAMFYADACLQTQNTDQAFSVLANLSEEYPTDYDLSMNFARLLYEAGKFNQSIYTLSNFSRNNANFVNEDMLTLKNQSFYHLKMTDSIEVTLGQLIKLNPSNLRYSGLLAEFFVSVGKYALADSVYNVLLLHNSSNAKILLSIANYKRIAGNFEEMLALYNRAFQDKSLGFKPFYDLYAYFKRQEGNAYCKLCNTMLDTLYAYFPDEKQVVEELYFTAYQANNQEKRIEYLQKLIRIAPDDFQFWQNLMDIYFISNDFEELYKTANSALELFPNQAILYYYAGVSALRSDRASEAVSLLKSAEMYEKSLENLSLRFQIMYALAEAHHFNQNYPESDKYFAKAIEIEPENLSLLNNYAYLLSKRKDKLTLAMSYIDKCLYYQPDYYIFIDTKAAVFGAMNDWDNALKYTRLALHKGGESDADILIHHADILQTLGKKSEAMEFYNRAYTLRPSDELLQIIKNEK